MKKIFLISIGGIMTGAAAFGLMQVKNNVNVLARPETIHVNTQQETAEKEPKKNPMPTRIQTPDVVRAAYLTAPSAGRENKIRAILAMKEDGLNAVVVDIKDSFGVVAYDSQLELVNRYHIERKFIPDLKALIERFHNEGLYVIARIAVFQDTALAEAMPHIAVHDKIKLNNTEGIMSNKTIWRDGKNLAWIDPSSHEAWEYIVALSNEVLEYGFDELNYDYIRFPSDGKISRIVYPITKRDQLYTNQIRSFMRYIREQLPDAVLSVDLFGFTMVKTEDIGIGQLAEDAYAYFDYIAPMVYPSHYPSGFMGYKNPAEWPYEIVADSMQKGQSRLNAYKTTASSTAKIRPWLQDFDLGANYNHVMIGKQIKATQDILNNDYAGYMLWNPSSNYTISAIQ